LDERRRQKRAAAGARTWDDLVDGFLKGYSKGNTRATYGRTVRRFLADLGFDIFDIASADSLRPQAVRCVVVKMAAAVRESTYRSRVSIVCRFLKWLEDECVVTCGIASAAKVKASRLELVPPSPPRACLSEERFEELVGAPGVALRERAYWRLIRDTSERPTVLLRLTVRDVDLSRRRCAIAGSGGPSSAIFTVVTAELLRGLVADRLDGPLFVSQRGGALAYRTAAEIIWKATGGTVTLGQLSRKAGERGA
jgi:integrase